MGPGHRASQPRAISRATHRGGVRPALMDQLIEISWGQAAAQTGISWEDYRKPSKCLAEALPGQPALGSNQLINRVVKAMVFPGVMSGCESWTTKQADAEKLMLSNCGAGEDS